MKTNIRFCFLSIIFLFSFISVSSSVIRKSDLRDGLSNNTVRSITFDSDGMIWLATDNGLNSFDGNDFVSYFPQPGNEYSISTNALNRVLADNDSDLIWIATQRRGLSAYEKKSGHFINYPIYDDLPNSVRAYGITDLSLGKDNDLWIATYQNGLKRLDKKTNIITHYNQSLVPGLKHNDLWCLYYDKKEDKLYIGYAFSGLSIISLQDNTIKHFYNEQDNERSLPGKRINQIYKDSRDRIWLTTDNGIGLYHPEEGDFTVFKRRKDDKNALIDNDVTCVEEINNELWFGTYKGGGISILNMDAEISSDAEFRNIYASDFEDGLSNPSVLSLKKDSFGNIWIGTNGGGINFISHNEPFFKKLSYSPIRDDRNGLSSKLIRTISLDQDNLLWIGTEDNGIDVYRGKEKVANFNKNNSSLSDNILRASLTDSNNNIWFAGHSEGVLLYNRSKQTFEKPFAGRKSIPSFVNCIFEDSRSDIWFGCESGVFRYTPHLNELKKYNASSVKLADNLIRTIAEDKNGNLWIGSEINGFSIVTPEFRLINHFHVKSGFCSNGVKTIMKDSQDRMWVGTLTGLAFFNNADSYDYSLINKSSGLKNEYIRAVAEGKDDEIWFSTSECLSRYCISSGKTDNYDYSDNVPQGAFLNSAVAKSDNGILWFGSQNGICYFDSKADPAGFCVPEIKITGFNIFRPQTIDNKDDIVSIPVSREVQLKYDQNTFSIFFSIMDNAMTDRINYSYSLKGADDSWYQTNGENHVTFRNIAPGKYTFKVKAAIRNQNFSEEFTYLNIIITPPIWLTWWAKGLYILIALISLFFIFRFYKRKLELEYQLSLEKENHQKDKALNDEKFRFYTNIAHELRTPLTLILGPLEDLTEDSRLQQDQQRKISTIFKSASRLSNLTNEILEFRKSETNNRKLCVCHNDICNHISEIVMKYKEFNQNKAVEINIKAETNDTVIHYDPEVITIILDNLISNAIKYTYEGSIDIIIRKTDITETPNIEIEVKDTGVGIPAEALDKIFDRYYQAKGEFQVHGTGIGLSLVKNMIILHEGNIEVKSTVNEGTSFVMRLAYDNEYPNALHTEEKETENTTLSNDESRPLLLIVEDNYDIREYITHSFIGDFEILIAENGKIGIELATERIPDIIISDVMMPVTDGMELTRKLKENINTCHIPIILLTAKTSDQDKNEGYSLGADSYMTKPFSAKILRTRVFNLLDSRKKIKNILSQKEYKKTVLENSMNKLDSEFIARITKIVESNLDSEELSIRFLSEQLNMSSPTFFRKIKAVTGMSGTDFIRRIKMRRAEELLLSREYSINDIAFKVGFNSAASFRKAYKAEFGISPTESLRKLEEEIETSSPKSQDKN